MGRLLDALRATNRGITLGDPGHKVALLTDAWLAVVAEIKASRPVVGNILATMTALGWREEVGYFLFVAPEVTSQETHAALDEAVNEVMAERGLPPVYVGRPGIPHLAFTTP